MAILSKPTTDLMLLSFKKVTPIINQVSNYAQTAVKSTNALLNKYPPLKVLFIYTLH